MLLKLKGPCLWAAPVRWALRQSPELQRPWRKTRLIHTVGPKKGGNGRHFSCWNVLQNTSASVQNIISGRVETALLWFHHVSTHVTGTLKQWGLNNFDSILANPLNKGLVLLLGYQWLCTSPHFPHVYQLGCTCSINISTTWPQLWSSA